MAPAVAQSVTMMTAMVCVPASEVAAITERSGERRVGSGLDANGKSIFEIYASRQGTFTIVRRDASGMACLLGTGGYWSSSKLPGEEEDL